MKHVFRESLVKGQSVEQTLADNYPDRFSRTDGRHGDLIALKTKSKIEVKAELTWIYNPHQACVSKPTVNLFVERYGDGDRRTSGGPYKALNDDASLFFEVFVRNNLVLAYPTGEFVAATDAYVATHHPPLKSILNVGYHSLGWAIPVQHYAKILLSEFALDPASPIHLPRPSEGQVLSWLDF